MDRWTKLLGTWAGLLGVLLMAAVVAPDDGGDDAYAPATAYDADPNAGRPTPTPNAAPPAGNDTENATQTPDPESRYTAQTNVTPGDTPGTWQAQFRVNATDVDNLTVVVTFEPRAGQSHWTTTRATIRLVDPDGAQQWTWGTGVDGFGGTTRYAKTVPGEDVVTGLWTFTFQWDGPTDTKATLDSWVDRNETSA